jgi:type IV pilus assembly protein PilC
MPKFTADAVDRAGRRVSRTIEAGSEAEATAALQRDGLTVNSVKAAGSSGPRKRSQGTIFTFDRSKAPARLSGEDLAVFTRQFATMIGAGIPVLECLDVLAEQAEDLGFKRTMNEIIEDIRGGRDLSTSLGEYPKVFDNIYVNMIKAGEASGQLEAILVRLAEYMESSVKLKREIKSAMVYPCISLTMIFLVTGFLMIFIIPQFAQIFIQLDVPLPTPTKMVLWTSKFMVAWWWIVILSVIGLFVALKIWKGTESGGYMVDKLTLKVPVFGPLFQKVALSRFARTFSTLISSGVPILGALDIVGSTSGNRVIEATVLSCKDSVRNGEPLSKPLAESPIFPPMVVRMIAIGERSGALEQLLEKISEFYDEQVSAAVESLTSMIEPIMIAIMGVLVGGIVISVFLPIIKIQQMLSKRK